MSKELTPLQALSEMYQVCLVANVADMSGDFELVKEALKNYETERKLRNIHEENNRELVIKLHNLKKEWHKLFANLLKENETITKLFSLEIEKNRAFEIIKEKRVDCSMLVLCQSHIEYNDMCETEKEKLTKEDYDLLIKELL